VGIQMRARIVGSGKYAIATGGDEVLDAFLGTCVGVVVYDRRAQKGGLIHLLLPEPTCTAAPLEPMFYAKTGLPIFISELYRKGAARERLEACVAGGALIGPLCNKDLILDIGGRTADEVARILHREGIPIRKSEIGGYLGYRISVSSSNWETLIEPCWGSHPEVMAGAHFERPKPEEVWKAAERLAPVPQTALKVIRMINDPECSFRDISKEIITDQVLSAKTIRFCNSPFFGPRQEIGSLERALTILGDRRLLQFVVSASLEDFLSQNENGYSLCKGAMFKHALGTALISAKVAEFSGRVPADMAYTAGLLHDIGKVVLDQFMASAYPLFYRRMQAERADIVEIERELFGMSHTEAGARLAAEWRLPEVLGAAIACHHNPGSAGSHATLTHTVYLADLIMSSFMSGLEIEKLNAESIYSSLRAIGCGVDYLPRLLERVLYEMANDPFLRLF
jgi:putative nucleotidyltransferase with HDIG domain